MRQSSLFFRAISVCLFLGLFAAFAFSQDKETTEGALHVIDREGKDAGLCPLKNTFVRAEISGFLSRVTVTQIFQNPFDKSIEAVYTFPLPNDAAVDDMTITVGERVIKGRIMERELLRPDLISSASLYTDAGGRKQINPAAFSIPPIERQGTLERNALRGFAFFQMDLGLERRFRFGSESNLRLKMEVFNVLNNTNFADMNGNLGTFAANGNFLPNSYFGQTVSTFGSQNFTPFNLYGGARTIQFSAKFVF